MPRIEGAEPRKLGFFAGLFVRLVYWFTRRKVGTTLTSMRVAAHHPRLLFGKSMMEAAALSSRLVDERLKTLTSVRVAMVAGCPH
ncbi:MAG TPA: hypothetical protein VFF06_24380 [Polyangia bacterium]|nr:hypothetical protein [Polyangia bacterium]